MDLFVTELMRARRTCSVRSIGHTLRIRHIPACTRRAVGEFSALRPQPELHIHLDGPHRAGVHHQ